MIDIHAHIWLGQERENAAAMRKAAAKFGIDAICISALGSHQPDEQEVENLNDRCFTLCREDSLFYPYVTVAPEQKNALSVLEKGIAQSAIGMKIWVSCLCDDPCCDPLYRRCAEAGLPVLVHTFAKAVGQLPRESTAVHLAAAARRHPDTNFILAHLGGNCYHGIPLIRDLPNVYTDFSGSGCRADDLPYALEQLGVERILFGTDMPGSFVMSFGQVLSARLTHREQELILSENARRLFPGLRNSL